MLAVEVERELGDDLSVRVGLEFETLALQELAQVVEVGNDT